MSYNLSVREPASGTYGSDPRQTRGEHEAALANPRLREHARSERLEAEGED